MFGIDGGYLYKERSYTSNTLQNGQLDGMENWMKFQRHIGISKEPVVKLYVRAAV